VVVSGLVISQDIIDECQKVSGKHLDGLVLEISDENKLTIVSQFKSKSKKHPYRAISSQFNDKNARFSRNVTTDKVAKHKKLLFAVLNLRYVNGENQFQEKLLAVKWVGSSAKSNVKMLSSSGWLNFCAKISLNTKVELNDEDFDLNIDDVLDKVLRRSDTCVELEGTSVTKDNRGMYKYVDRNCDSDNDDN